MSTTSMFQTLARLQSDHICVHQDRCVMVRNRNSKCAKCSDVCTSGCISMQNGVICVEQDKCIGCGTCSTVCPTGALEARLPNDAALLGSCLRAARSADGECVIACSRLVDEAYGSFDPRKVVEVKCLGRVDESLLAALAENGASSVSLACRACDDCEHVEGRYACELVCSTASDLFEAWGVDVAVSIVDEMPDGVSGDASFEPVERTEGEEAAAAGVSEEAPVGEEVAYKPVHVMEDGTLPHFIPDRRERLLDSLASFGEPADGQLSLRLWGHVVIDTQKCTSCRACAIFCPTGAIRKWGDDETDAFGVEHYPGDCVKCLCCENICPKDALTVLDEVDASCLLSGSVEHIQMPPIAVRRGGRDSILNSIRSLSGMEEIYDR